jgi:predicted GNAT family acetyltransferase
LWGGATVPAYRKRGLYTALVSARAQEAKARGIRCLTIDASPASRAILEKFGFQLMAYAWECNYER